MITINEIKSLAGASLEKAIEERRHLHKNPELSFREEKTSGYIRELLKSEGIPFIYPVAGTGILGIINGEAGDGPTVALRAELDALPIREANIVPYRSSRDGVMHACGHDAHMAMLMGATRIVNSLKKKMKGRVLIIFQPGEEVAPGGASKMIAEGIFRTHKPDIIIAHHVLPELTTGKVGYRPGKYMASSDEIYISVEGKGGHAALPGESTDQVYIASKLVCTLKEEINEKAKTKSPTVLGIGRFLGEGATNIIPAKVIIAGTFRTFDEEWRGEVHEIIRSRCSEFSDQYKVKVEAEIVHGFPVLENHEKLTSEAIRLSGELLGKDSVVELPLRMSSEDFALYSKVAPSLFYRVGINKPGTNKRSLHSPEFDLDEEAMVTGIANMSWLAFNFLDLML